MLVRREAALAVGGFDPHHDQMAKDAAVVLPGHSARRYWMHARQVLLPGRGEGIREAAETYNRQLGSRE
jgi:hypothetical protein